MPLKRITFELYLIFLTHKNVSSLFQTKINGQATYRYFKS